MHGLAHRDGRRVHQLRRLGAPDGCVAQPLARARRHGALRAHRVRRLRVPRLPEVAGLGRPSRIRRVLHAARHRALRGHEPLRGTPLAVVLPAERDREARGDPLYGPCVRGAGAHRFSRLPRRRRHPLRPRRARAGRTGPRHGARAGSLRDRDPPRRARVAQGTHHAARDRPDRRRPRAVGRGQGGARAEPRPPREDLPLRAAARPPDQAPARVPVPGDRPQRRRLQPAAGADRRRLRRRLGQGTEEGIPEAPRLPAPRPCR